MEDYNVIFQVKQLNQLIMNLLSKDKKFPSNAPKLSLTQMRIIDYIAGCEKDVYQNTLEEVLGITRYTVSDVLKTMEKYGLIKRVISKNDSRTKKIILTEKAIKSREDGEKVVNELNTQILKNISTEELKKFNKTILKMINNIEKLNN